MNIVLYCKCIYIVYLVNVLMEKCLFALFCAKIDCFFVLPEKETWNGL